MRFYCDNVDETGHKCLATFPCAIHPEKPVNGFKLLVGDGRPIHKKPITRIVETKIITLPCHHNYPFPEGEKKINIKCEECPREYFLEIMSDVVEITGLN